MNAISSSLLNKMSQEHLNQQQLAETLGIKPCLLSLLLSGKRTPSLQVVKAIYHKYPDLVEVLLG